MDKTSLSSGVSQITLFKGIGEILCDRLIFIDNGDRLKIKAETIKSVFKPYELVEMEFSLSGKGTYSSFSLSVRDGANEVDGNHNILTDLLLMSEIKGYVRNPSYYFDEADSLRREALDLLLMVQGWRRYSWKQMAGVEPFELKYLPEQGVETHNKQQQQTFSYQCRNSN